MVYFIDFKIISCFFNDVWLFTNIVRTLVPTSGHKSDKLQLRSDSGDVRLAGNYHYKKSRLIIKVFSKVLIFKQIWALGVLLTKILTALVLTGPQWWLRQVIDRVHLYIYIFFKN